MTVETAGSVSREDKERFEREGFLVVEDTGIPEHVIDGAVADVTGKFETEHGAERWEDGVYYTSHRIMDAWKISESIKAIALNPKIHRFLEELYGRTPLPFQTLNFPFGTQQKAHSDTIHFNTMPPGYMAGVWVALEDIDMDNGPLFYYPGSQKLPELNMQDIGAEADHSQYGEYEKAIADVIEKHDLEPHYALLKKGQALIWSANILHGGAPQKDMSRSRHSQVTHFFFEGCRYYTPLMSKDVEAGDIDWRDPDWIR
jgi:hypothetical protein